MRDTIKTNFLTYNDVTHQKKNGGANRNVHHLPVQKLRNEESAQLMRAKNIQFLVKLSKKSIDTFKLSHSYLVQHVGTSNAVSFQKVIKYALKKAKYIWVIVARRSAIKRVSLSGPRTKIATTNWGKKFSWYLKSKIISISFYLGKSTALQFCRVDKTL